MTDLRFLSSGKFGEVVRTFEKAFSDYPIKMKDSPGTWLMGRCKKNAVSWEHSVGVFDGDRMVGFTLLGLDTWKGGLAAFDAGTGLIPEFRGRKLGPAMLDFGTERLQEEGVERLVLEVLQENEAAIRAYRRVGFQITREFDCYQWKADDDGHPIANSPRFTIRPVSMTEASSFEPDLDWEPSWENSLRAIARIHGDTLVLGAFEKGECMGMIVCYPLMNWILNLTVRRGHRDRGIGGSLLRHVLTMTPCQEGALKLNNVEATDTHMGRFLEKRGFQVYTRQYEMERVPGA